MLIPGMLSSIPITGTRRRKLTATGRKPLQQKYVGTNNKKNYCKSRPVHVHKNNVCEKTTSLKQTVIFKYQYLPIPIMLTRYADVVYRIKKIVSLKTTLLTQRPAENMKAT